MPLPREAVYNELNGEEVRQILRRRVDDLLSTVPYLQRHLTLPRVRMTVTIDLVVRADQQGGERHRIADDFTVRTEDTSAADEPSDVRLSGHDAVDAAPGPAGRPPGQIRDEFGLPDAVPTRGPVATHDEMVHGNDIPMPPDAAYGRLPTEQEKLTAYREKEERMRALAEPPAPPVTLPGVMVERGRRQTHVTMDRGGPAMGGNDPVPVEAPTLRNAGAAPDPEAREEFKDFRGTGISKGNRRQ